MATLGRFKTLAPDPKLIFLTVTLGSKADIPFRHVNAEINGDNRLEVVIQRGVLCSVDF